MRLDQEGEIEILSNLSTGHILNWTWYQNTVIPVCFCCKER